LHHRSQKRDRKKWLTTWGLRYAKIDIKLKNNLMNIIAYRARQKIPENMILHRRKQATQEINDPLRMTREVHPTGA
jgi:hypothetical protein